MSYSELNLKCFVLFPFWGEVAGILGISHVRAWTAIASFVSLWLVVLKGEVGPNLVEIKPDLVYTGFARLGPILAKFNRKQATVDRHLSKFGRVWPIWAEIGPNWSKSGQIWSTSGRSWSTSVQTRKESDQLWPTRTTLGRSGPALAQIAPTLVNIERNRFMANVGRVWQESGQGFPNSGKLGRIRPNSCGRSARAGARPHAAQILQNLFTGEGSGATNLDRS